MPVKARAVEVPLRRGDILLERCMDLGVRVDDGHGLTLLFSTISWTNFRSGVDPGSKDIGQK